MQGGKQGNISHRTQTPSSEPSQLLYSCAVLQGRQLLQKEQQEDKDQCILFEVLFAFWSPDLKWALQSQPHEACWFHAG